MIVRALRSQKEGVRIPGAWNALTSYPQSRGTMQDPWPFLCESSAPSHRTLALQKQDTVFPLPLQAGPEPFWEGWSYSILLSKGFRSKHCLSYLKVMGWGWGWGQGPGAHHLSPALVPHASCYELMKLMKWVYELIGPKKRTTSSVQTRNAQTVNSKGQGPCPGSLPSLLGCLG